MKLRRLMMTNDPIIGAMTPIMIPAKKAYIKKSYSKIAIKNGVSDSKYIILPHLAVML